MDKVIKALGAALGVVLGFLGGWNVMLTVLMCVMVADYATGFIVAACGRSQKTEEGRLSSKVGFIGLAKKGFILFIVLLATLLDRAVGNETMVFQMGTACYYIANEGLSILENAALLGVPFPKIVRKALETMRDRGDDDDPEDET